MAQNFTQSDREMAIKFGQLLQKASFDVTTKELIEISKCLVWYNSLPQKISDHIIELRAIREPAPAPTPKSSKKAKE